jgi:hypothetical protein
MGLPAPRDYPQNAGAEGCMAETSDAHWLEIVFNYHEFASIPMIHMENKKFRTPFSFLDPLATENALAGIVAVEGKTSVADIS